jgi:hypothetical protein
MSIATLVKVLEKGMDKMKLNRDKWLIYLPVFVIDFIGGKKINFKKYLLPILYIFCLCMVLLAISLTGCTPLNTQSNHQKNHGLVEVCVSSQIAPHKTPFLLRKLSQESPAIDTISYDCISLSSSLPFFTPYTYGYNHYEKVYASWTGEMSQDDIQNLRYSLFLKADRIYLYEFNDEHCFADNLAYDLVPLKGDIKEEYDGIGFPLFSSSNEYPTKENPYITLSTEPFTIPFIEGFTEEQQPNWSLHLILNDGTNMSNNLYSWSFPINGEEK